MKPIKPSARAQVESLSPDEIGYLLGLLKEHIEYHRLLAGNGHCTPQNRAKLEFLETLWLKLAK